MKTLTIKRDSWHHKLAKLHDRYFDGYSEIDICSYTRLVLVGLLKFLVALAGLIFILICVFDLVMWLGFCIFYKEFLDPRFPAMVGFSFAMAAGIIGVAFGGEVLIRNHSFADDNFLYTAYRSFKDKFCVKVTIIDKETQPIDS